ncbi:MAG: 5'-3' exonuclease [Candidatus Moeniiplasma glomeromycotorum]|nr:5'-3' exonuclease [Candidatus Moeniiplasma glomeromycotorum]MCE8162445.1 5'-3' exonuclease [Candidatus Moeniiplasma glomeromycotorum]MCE8163133.1 5'-3' exonuclease [Candidatus Moeniiplasma glomeromycotorum]MCE8166371.1 5'-3' exonuclease [Candidatus Moeniiplasma glomeromycotorum]MCE8166853.1 5'-3' exonuclease [Candidatus Moeniiplasma glomeromycotorum]
MDGNNLLYSSYHAVQNLPTPVSQGAIFLFLRVLISILRKTDYQKLLVFFDGGGVNFRESLLPQYKAQREKMPAELFEQLGVLQELLKKTNLTYLQLINCEADDLIASFVEQNQKKYPHCQFDIFSRDKDLLQLLSQNTSVLKYNKEKKMILYNRAAFWQEYGFSPLNYVDYLSLIGDQVDNIKGVKGIGPVGAKKLIQQFGAVENIFQNLTQLPINTQKLLENQQEIVYQNKKLISLVKNINLPADIDQKCNFEWEKWKTNPALKLFCENNHFKSILNFLK